MPNLLNQISNTDVEMIDDTWQRLSAPTDGHQEGKTETDGEHT